MVKYYNNNVENRVATKSILIVDDHEALRLSLKLWLNNLFPDYTFLEAGNGEEAIEVASKNKPALVVMDIKLPTMNGIETTRLIKKMIPEAKVVVISMYDAPDYVDSANDAGATAFIPKHKMNSELIPLLKRLLFMDHLQKS